ncbi:hypothetical protein [Streptomyces sp. NPDC005303]|uniref:hypothetical protein n=1 Tax=Streptomyces sp. NPDC005303 TaxID=3155713 RepID=UPI0033B6A4A6
MGVVFAQVADLVGEKFGEGECGSGGVPGTPGPVGQVFGLDEVVNVVLGGAILACFTEAAAGGTAPRARQGGAVRLPPLL